MCIQAETIKYSNTRLEHQNSFQKSKTQIALGQLGSTPIHLQAKHYSTTHTSIKKQQQKKQTKALHIKSPEGKQTASTHTRTMKQHLSLGVVKFFWVIWNKSGKCQAHGFGDSLQHNETFNNVKT